MQSSEMMIEAENRLFNLDTVQDRLPRVGLIVKRPLEKLLALPGINGVYARAIRTLADTVADPTQFCDACLADLGVAVRVSAADLSRIPKTGPVVVVANHPFGGIEGLILSSVLLRTRPDAKLMVNQFLHTIPEMRETCVFVDNITNDPRTNARGLKESLQHLRRGGLLGVFPAGTVSHLQLDTRRVEDPAWSTHVGGLIRRTGAAVVPLYFEGRNGKLFQLAGLIHPRLRTMMLPREVLNKQNSTRTVQIGRVISPRELATFDSDEKVVDYLRSRTYSLSARQQPEKKTRLGRTWRRTLRRVFGSDPQAIAVPQETHWLTRELSQLPADAKLATTGDLSVYLATYDQVPLLMQEVGRLREITFRAVGEGTGKPVDLDAFDKTYRHLLLWNDVKHELVGGYRLGLADELVGRSGNSGLYVHTLFDFPADFLFRLGPAIELGRSFVRPEYQRSFTPLMLLWKGIGTFIARNPQYRYLFGPVSISNVYSRLSRALVAEFMQRPQWKATFAGAVRPRMPFKIDNRTRTRVEPLAARVHDIDELSDQVADLEFDGKGIPILLRQYAKLGAKGLAFNVDPAFGHCLDCLCLLDLLDGDTRHIERYMGRDHIIDYFAAHGRELPPRGRKH